VFEHIFAALAAIEILWKDQNSVSQGMYGPAFASGILGRLLQPWWILSRSRTSQVMQAAIWPAFAKGDGKTTRQ
jgi:hypothetical protein